MQTLEHLVVNHGNFVNYQSLRAPQSVTNGGVEVFKVLDSSSMTMAKSCVTVYRPALDIQCCRSGHRHDPCADAGFVEFIHQSGDKC